MTLKKPAPSQKCIEPDTAKKPGEIPGMHRQRANREAIMETIDHNASYYKLNQLVGYMGQNAPGEKRNGTEWDRRPAAVGCHVLVQIKQVGSRPPHRVSGRGKGTLRCNSDWHGQKDDGSNHPGTDAVAEPGDRDGPG